MRGNGEVAIVEEESNKSKSASKRTTVVKTVTERNESIVMMEAKAERAHFVCVKKRRNEHQQAGAVNDRG